MKKDEQTGLPELPEGMFWRVKRWDPSSTLPEVQPSVIVSIRREIKYEVPSRRRIDLGPFSFYWGWETETVQKTEEVENGTVMTEENVTVHPRDLTSADIVRTAERVFTRWQKTVEASSLLGDYPPKKLIVKEKEVQ